MDSDGKDFRAISAFENFEWTPSVSGGFSMMVRIRWETSPEMMLRVGLSEDIEFRIR